MGDAVQSGKSLGGIFKSCGYSGRGSRQEKTKSWNLYQIEVQQEETQLHAILMDKDH